MLAFAVQKKFVLVALLALISGSSFAETIKLRTTKMQDQGSTQHCWVFSGLNLLETNYLEANPEVSAKEVELSREHIQKVAKIYQRGTLLDALYWSGYFPQIGFELKGGKLKFRGKMMSAHELMAEIVGDQKFQSYGFSETRTGWHPHADTDAKPGTKSYFVKPEFRAEIIARALKLRKAVSYTKYGHIAIVYGADFDSRGLPVKVYVKDSLNGWLEGPATKLYNEMIEITTVADLL